jgi:hypothetical protein
MIPLSAGAALPINLTGGVVLAVSIVLTLAWIAYLVR